MTEFLANIDTIEKVKSEIMGVLNFKFMGTSNKEDMTALYLALDELLVNIVEHSENGVGSFKIDMNIFDGTVDVYISDCDLIDPTHKRATLISNDDLILRGKQGKRGGGMGLKTTSQVMDDFKIFKVAKNGRGSSSGIIFKISKCLVDKCKINYAAV